ncbi:MAG TPA: hypothetical protein VGC93_00565 [Thermoanaerobaculia bacterium]
MLEQTVLSAVGLSVVTGKARVWVVFGLCLLFSTIGVGLSFLALGTTINGYRLYGVGLVIAVTMLGVSYGAKYANTESRESFTPLDLIQYLGQGFLWPSAWPALAERIGVPPVDVPTERTSWVLDEVIGILSV